METELTWAEKGWPPALAIGISVIAVVGTIGAYLYFFAGNSAGGPADWGVFGDYFGGVTSAVLSFAAVLLLSVQLLAIRAEGFRNRRLLEAAESQRSRESRRREIWVALEKAEEVWTRRTTTQTMLTSYLPRQFMPPGEALISIDKIVNNLDFAAWLQSAGSADLREYRLTLDELAPVLSPYSKVVEDVVSLINGFEAEGGSPLVAAQIRRWWTTPAWILRSLNLIKPEVAGVFPINEGRMAYVSPAMG
jgi:uncharacterized membrane protein